MTVDLPLMTRIAVKIWALPMEAADHEQKNEEAEEVVVVLAPSFSAERPQHHGISPRDPSGAPAAVC